MRVLVTVDMAAVVTIEALRSQDQWYHLQMSMEEVVYLDTLWPEADGGKAD